MRNYSENMVMRNYNVFFLINKSFKFNSIISDVNGKVVHLVQRAPPSQRGNANPSNLEPSSAVPNINIRAPLNYRTIDGVVLGAVSIPMNANNGVLFFFINMYNYKI